MNSESIDQLVFEIYELQMKANRKYWQEGLFPNFRSNNFFGYIRPDNSIFFTASIVFILNSIKDNLSENSQYLIEKIAIGAVKNYKNYQSATGEFIYNFYPTQPSQHFANGLIFKYFKHFQLPHDADDTALIYLTSHHNHDQQLWLQAKLAKHSNGQSKIIVNTFEIYKNLEAYSTWFGKNMAIEFDAVVLSNIIYCQLLANLKLDVHGLASWEYIKNIILSDEYIKNPFETSHNYAKTSIIAYHVGRLVAKFDLPDAQKIREKLSFDLLKILEKKTRFSLDNILISNTLYRIGQDHVFEYSYPISDNYINHYSFFMAGLLSSYESKLLKLLSKYSIFHLHWTCPAHTKALVLENMVLKSLNT